jgi:hypothetical protein
VDIESVFGELMDGGVSVWLDTSGRLLIDKSAPAKLKELVRAYKQEIIDALRARRIMRRPVRCIRLPLGHLAIAYPPGANLDEIRWAMRVLRMDPMPLVINDDGLEWISPREWRRREITRILKEHRREQLKAANGSHKAPDNAMAE